MNAREAAETSMGEYRLRLEGYNQQQRLEWERSRWQVFLLMQMHPNIKQHNKPKTPSEWIRFEWEKEEQFAPNQPHKITDTDREKLAEIFGTTIRKRNG